ncbi:oxysterol-binding protein-related protein 8-like [Centruroides vittatus]|uniref:oxysterol-binding protein-related protein 8-like n=1 Tax=Centruroides vittatus TaxID=120091 RepID=UPI00350FF842
MANQPQNYLMFSDWMKLLTVSGTWEEIWVMLRQESIKLYQQKNEYEISKWQLEPLLFLAPSELAYKCWINALSVVAEKFVEITNKEVETSAKETTMNTILADKDSMENPKIVETIYVERVLQKQNTEETMDLGKMIWSLLSKFREGNNFSLPISLLEPRSSLDKFADSFLHIDILSEAAIEKDPLTRMKLVVKWYLSGFYLQSKSLKKPYIPKMGEAFRCFWYHPKTDSKTFFLAEQISDKPQEVAIHIINQKDGFRLNGSFIVNLSFSGNTVTLKVEDKNYHVTLLPFKEKYTLAMPYIQMSGILTGNIVIELGGEIKIACDKTLYNTILNFKLKVHKYSFKVLIFKIFKTLFGNSEYDEIHGTINSNSSIIAIIKGHWNDSILLEDNQTHKTQCFWNPTPDIRKKGLKQFVVPIEEQTEFESEKLWLPLTEAIFKNDQQAADYQFAEIVKKVLNPEKKPKYFIQDKDTQTWIYKYIDLIVWKSEKHNYQFENDFIIQSGYHPEGNAICLKSKLSIEESIKSARNSVKENPIVEVMKSMEQVNKKYEKIFKSMQSNLELIKFQQEEVQNWKITLFLLGIFGGLLILKVAVSNIIIK